MHEQQRKFFASSDRFCIASSRRYGRSYAQKDREATLKAIEVAKTKNNLKLIAVDEFKEMSPQDIEKLREMPCMQSFISTENSDWLREYSKEQGHDRE